MRITRVVERFEVETETLPFERQTIRNEALPEGETRLLQPGVNGAQETTYRILEEEGAEISRTPVKTTIQNSPVPEIIMVGAQTAFSPVPVEGTLAYLSGSTAWVMSGDSGNRRPVLLDEKLDGRVFKLSPDGKLLLYTVEGPEDDPAVINSLRAVVLSDPDPTPIDLGADNIIHFADFSPAAGEAYRVAYSTSEASAGSPGWQANNDLVILTFASSGTVVDIERVLDASSGGPYGWWGTTFAWSTDGTRLAYARPDGIGIVDLEDAALEPAVDMTPYQTLGDWAWVPGVAWGQDGRTLYFVEHGPPTGLEGPGRLPGLRPRRATRPRRADPQARSTHGHVRIPVGLAGAAIARRRDCLPACIPSGAGTLGKPDQYLSTRSARPRWKQPDCVVPGQRRGRPFPPTRRLVAGRFAAWIDLPG